MVDRRKLFKIDISKYCEVIVKMNQELEKLSVFGIHKQLENRKFTFDQFSQSIDYYISLDPKH